MSIVPSLTPRQLLTILLKAGFKILRQKGSHIRLEHPITRRNTTIAMHAAGLSRKMILKILGQAGVSIREFLRLLGR